MSEVEVIIPVEDMTEEVFRAELVKKIKAFKRNILLKNSALTKKYASKAKKRFQEIVTSSVQAYYEDYDPITYRRKYSLYDAFNIDVTPDHWYVDMDPEIYRNNNNDHGDLSEYIYDYMFTEGYHGGVIKGDYHPEPGKPWWGYASNGQVYWVAPAPQTVPSPYEMIYGGIEDASDELLDEYGNELYDKLKKDYDNIIDFINKYLEVK